MINFQIDTKDLERQMEKLTRIDKAEIHEGVGVIIENHVVDKIDQLGLVDTGQFIKTINYDANPDYAVIQDAVKYGVYLEYGTRPHEIRPKTANALTIPKGGGRLVWRKGKRKTALKSGKITDVIFTKKVMHPGTKEYAPFRKGLIDSQVEVTKYARDKIIERATK